VVAGAAATTLVAVVGSATPSTPQTTARALCGIERWDVKTLTDSGARKLDLRPRLTSVWTLTRLRVRPTLSGPRRSPVETTVYQMRARLVASRAEADQDIHLIVAGVKHPAATMIVEFPHPACTVGAPAALRQRMSAARTAFLRACGQPPATLTGTATITGVGFVDVPHATGAAPNGIELHPVLGFAARNCA
jgi:hypothetical protein